MKENVKIADMTTMRLGGEARYVFEIENYEQVREAHEFAKKNNLEIFVLGAGANVIGRDEGFGGVVMRNQIKGMEMRDVGDVVEVSCGGGEILDDAVKLTASEGLTGIEALASIPGTVGAAPVQNVGAYGQEFGNVVKCVKAYDFETGESVKIAREKCGFGYRRSIFNYGPDAGRYFIYEVVIELKKGEMEKPFYNSLQRYVDENGIKDFSPESVRQMVKRIRSEKLPDPEKIASSGSFFKNVVVNEEQGKGLEKMGVPVFEDENGRVKVNTGWLIENAGLKGKLIRGMRVSEQAALVLINEEAGSYEDLAAAREEIKRAVKEKFGVELEQEPVEMTQA